MTVRARRARRRRPAPTAPARISAGVAGAVLLWAIACEPALGGEGDRDGGSPSPPAPTPADVALIGSDAAAGAVRPVIEELLSREGFVVAWSRPQRFQAEQLLAGGEGARRAPMAVWIDLSSSGEARMYFRDGLGQRFALRRLACRPTFDELAAEEIAQVVKSVLLALAGGNDRAALSLSEARAALAPSAVPAPPADRVRPSSRAPAVEIRAVAVAQRFAPPIPMSDRVELNVAVLSARAVPPESGRPGRFGAWLAGGYGLPMEYSDGVVGVTLRTAVLRAGALWEPWHGSLLSIRVGLGAGVDWVTFQPRAGTGGVTAAPPGRFVTRMGSLVAGVGFDPGEHLSIAVSALVDVAGSDVHYDLVDSGGMPARVLVPFVVRPGLSLGAGWRF